ncbi:MAG: AEC family transporter, partial [Anaerolineae bacterium]
PLLYATALGLILNLLQVSPPEPVQKAIHLLGQASIPTMLVVLGGQLVTTVKDRQANLYLAPMATVVGMRLLLAPALAWAIGWLLGLQGLTLNVVVLESAMPTAVISTILATEFDSDPPFAALAVLLTTLVSIPTVTILLNWLI